MSSISGNFNNQNLFQKLDTNNDGKVSFKEIKNLFTKGIENKENTKENGSINTEDKPLVENYKAHESEANSLNFDSPQSSKVEGSDGPGDGNWKNDTYANHDPAKDIEKGSSNFNKEALLQKTNNDPNVVDLLNKIGNDKKAGHYIEKLFQDNPDKASEICKSLSTYLDTPASPNALVDSDKKLSYVKDLLHDVAYPTDIAQKNQKTCGATAVQVQLAIQDPKQYIELSTSLADGKPHKDIQPNRNYSEGGLFSGDSRTLSAKIVQNAFMDFGNGGVNGDWSSKTKDGGIDTGDVSNLQKELFGGSEHLNSNMPKDEMIKKIDDTLKSGDPVAFSVKGHEMLVLSKNEDGSYNIFTWGEERKMSKEDFEANLVNAQIAK